MSTRVDQDDHKGARRNRRLDAVIVLLFGVMILGGLAVFPLSVTANKLSGLWITLCASLGID
ncbi:hypothetical protein GCM10017083_29290 [Thalassobaculum fulvum]|uniref:Uncharacterized protein n=1 Tax=Thalassobaculum fulvum TaxID=1633335 RepID=A0A919CQ81_9PROT|nr:hypothetical protein [Thalassobaculum fulvum]GHD53063.1 hypothetical protein GCM10017083_29290 [Thalassobaculum fulvum]